MYQDYRADRRPRDYSGEDVRFEGAERPADHELEDSRNAVEAA